MTHLAPGTYTIHVNDQADIHYFDLFGPGVKESTGVDTTGMTTWTVTFQNGTYTYVVRRSPRRPDAGSSRSAHVAHDHHHDDLRRRRRSR